ncbi:hypothetical protein EVC30_145 [Rhizobium phage RHph_Y1_11]|nr:hypothetical protein EVC30_145 [Rhizobium phage RHph_Y1_11]
MLPGSVLRTIKLGQVIKTGPLLPKLSDERLEFKATVIHELPEGGVEVKFDKSYMGVFAGTAAAHVSASGETKWEL